MAVTATMLRPAIYRIRIGKFKQMDLLVSHFQPCTREIESGTLSYFKTQNPAIEFE